jgi:hypothetical protein
MRFPKKLFLILTLNFAFLSGANAQQGKPMSDESMFYCIFIGERLHMNLRQNSNPKMQELSRTALAVWDGYMPFAKRFVNQNKFSDAAIQSAKNAIDALPLDQLIQPLLNCRDNPKNRINVK